MSNELGFDEVVDMTADAIEFADFVEDRLEDGAGGDDLFAIIPKYPLLVEMYNDRKLFAAQAKDLTLDEYVQAVEQIAERVGQEVDVVRQKANAALRLSVRVINFYSYAKNEVEGIIADAKALVKKNAA